MVKLHIAMVIASVLTLQASGRIQMKFQEVDEDAPGKNKNVCRDSGWQKCWIFNDYCSHIYNNGIYAWFMRYHCCQHCVKRQERLDKEIRECQDSNLVKCSNYRQYCHHIDDKLKYEKFMRKHCCAFCTDPNIDTWVIHGHIRFDKTPGVLPPKSCLQITLWQTRRWVLHHKQRNKHPHPIKTMEYKVREVRVGKTYQYWLIIDRLHETKLWPGFYLTAALNVGWCAWHKVPGRFLIMENSWRKGDYRLEKRKRLYLEKNYHDYGSNDLVLRYQK